LDFFLDTGIFLGICDIRDYHHADCERLFCKYPQSSNRYFTAKKVKEELERKRIKRRKAGWSEAVLRRIDQRISIYLRSMEGVVEYGGEHKHFDKIANAIVSVVGYNTHDACIVANALIWSYEKAQNNPTLVTADYKDIVGKRDEIIKQAELRIFDRYIPLRITGVWDI